MVTQQIISVGAFIGEIWMLAGGLGEAVRLAVLLNLSGEEVIY
ncbi:hypothetical protein ABIE12_004563 [Serratia sp. 509]